MADPFVLYLPCLVRRILAWLVDWRIVLRSEMCEVYVSLVWQFFVLLSLSFCTIFHFFPDA